MRSRMLVAAGLAAGLVASTALAEDGYRHGRVFFVEPGVTLQRATEVSAEEATANLPFLPGDRVWTDAAGRAEFQFPDGTVVRLDRRSKLDYAGHEEGQERARGAPALVGQHVPPRAHARLRPLRGRDAGRHGPGARPRDAARRRRGRRDARERLRRRGGPRRRPAAGAPRRGRAHVRALGRRGRGAAALRARRGGRRLRPVGRHARVRGARGRPLVRVPPRRARRLRGRVRAQRPVAVRGRGRLRVGPARRGRLAALLERPLGVDALRLDLGPLRALGLGPLPLRALGASRRPWAGTGCPAAPGARAG